MQGFVRIVGGGEEKKIITGRLNIFVLEMATESNLPDHYIPAVVLEKIVLFLLKKENKE